MVTSLGNWIASWLSATASLLCTLQLCNAIFCSRYFRNPDADRLPKSNVSSVP